MNISMVSIKSHIKYIIIFLVVFGIYLFTAYPTIPPYRDSGDLIAASYSLGNAHPPGYPLYSLLGKICIVLVPFGNIAYRVNLMSIIFASLTVMILAGVIINFIPNNRKTYYLIFAVIVPCLLLAFSSAFWSLAHVSEMYTMSTFFVVLMIYLIIKYKWNNDYKIIYLLWFLFGLGISSHPTVVFLFPGFVLYVWQNRKQFSFSYYHVINFIGFFVLGLSIYVYLPVRSITNPVLDWGNPETLNNFVRVITRADYGGLKLHPEQSKFAWSVFSLFEQCKLFVVALIDQFTIFGLILGLVGIYYSFYNKTLSLIFPGFILTGVGFFILSNLPPGEKTTLPILEPHLVFPNLLFVLFISYAIIELIKKFRWRVGLYFIVLVPIAIFIRNLPEEYSRNHYFGYDYGKNILKTMPKNSILYDPDDPTAFIINYLRLCEHRRQDTKPVLYFRTKWGYNFLKRNYPDIFPEREILNAQDFISTIFKYNINKKGIFTDINPKIPDPYRAVSCGLLYRAVKKMERSKILSKSEMFYRDLYTFRGEYNTELYEDFFTKRILYYYSSSYNNIGLEYAKRKMYKKAEKYYNQSLFIKPDLKEAWNNLGTLAYTQKKYQHAIKYFEKALKLNPEDSGIIFNIGLVYKLLGDTETAEKYFNKMIEKGFYPQALNELGLIALGKGKPKNAINTFNKIIERNPQYSYAYYNLGLAYQEIGDYNNSVANYRKYMKYVSDAAEKQEVEEIIKKLKLKY